MEPNKPKRYRRTKAAIENGIKSAAETIILKKGFSGMTVLDIIKQAKIEPVTFYSRYHNLEEFYDSFVKEYDYWLSEVMRTSADRIYDHDRYVEILTNLIECLKDDSIMLELLRWEVNDANNVTKRVAMNREEQTLPLTTIYGDMFKDSGIDIVAISTLLIAGIYYLNLHRKCSPFCGIDVTTEEGRNRLTDAITSLSGNLFRQTNAEDRLAAIAARMRQKGLSEADIAFCLSDQ